jgi:hypothetical protein
MEENKRQADFSEVFENNNVHAHSNLGWVGSGGGGGIFVAAVLCVCARARACVCFVCCLLCVCVCVYGVPMHSPNAARSKHFYPNKVGHIHCPSNCRGCNSSVSKGLRCLCFLKTQGPRKNANSIYLCHITPGAFPCTVPRFCQGC